MNIKRTSSESDSTLPGQDLGSGHPSDGSTHLELSRHQQEPRTDEDAESQHEPHGGLLGRRMTLGLVGLGMLALTPGRANAQPNRGNQPFSNWQQDVDANGHELSNLGGLQFQHDSEVVSSLLGGNLAVDAEGVLSADDTRTNVSEGGTEVASNVSDINFDAGFSVDSDGDGSVTVQTESPWTETTEGGLLKTTGFDGIEVKQVQAPENEDLTVGADADLLLSITGGQGAIRIETGGGHKVILDDDAESLAVEDGAGNSVHLDSSTGEVAISATSKITLDAPEIELSAGSQLNVTSAGLMDIGSAGPMDIAGTLVRLNGGGSPAVRVTDPVSVPVPGGLEPSLTTGTILGGSPTVLIGD